MITALYEDGEKETRPLTITQDAGLPGLCTTKTWSSMPARMYGCREGKYVPEREHLILVVCSRFSPARFGPRTFTPSLRLRRPAGLSQTRGPLRPCLGQHGRTRSGLALPSRVSGELAPTRTLLCPFVGEPSPEPQAPILGAPGILEIRGRRLSR